MSVEQWSDLLFSEAGPRDGHAYGSVRAVNEDGSYMVQLNASNTLTRCAPFCTAMVGDRVKVVINANGKCDAIGRLGGEIGGGGGDSFDNLTVENNLSIHGAIQMDTSEAIRGLNPATGNYVVAFQAQNDGGNTTVGFGNYHAGSGDTEIYGNGLSLFSKTDIRVTSPTAGLTSRQYGVNKVLWAGAMYMNASQTATLNEAVTAQPNGIVLLWSRYSGGQVNDGWSAFFVPKAMMPEAGGYYRLHCSAMSPWWNMAKVVTVQDTQVVGYAVNEGSQTNSPVTWNASNFVLRYVIGV